MLKGIRNLIKKVVYRYRYDSDAYIDYLRKLGAHIGKDVTLFSSTKVNIDNLNPHLLYIGDHVNIVAATILTHDYSWAVIKSKFGEILGNQKEVRIGNNVFIGMGTIILCGSTIGDNVIVGANSVVSGNIESDSVYAGNPAKKIMSLDEYREKRRSRQLEEAAKFVKDYYYSYNKFPDEDKLHEYFYLFTDGKKPLSDTFRNKLHLCENYEQSMCWLNEHAPRFNGYDEFIKYCMECINHE
jgi:acetyltransferase-like isoleucine patch superfamily enzyme